MANSSGIEIPKVDFTTLNSSEIEVGSYFIGFDQGNGGKLSKMDHLGSITLIEGAAASQFTYEIGEYIEEEGGVIFHRYKDGTAENYLVVDLQDLVSSDWSNVNSVLTEGATSLWRGGINQELIILQLGAISGAAFLCEASTNGSLTDWYLPAIQELNKLWTNMLEVSKGIEVASGNQLVFDNYWSSTEYDLNTAWNFYFSNGTATNIHKNYTFYVRAVRKFSI